MIDPPLSTASRKWDEKASRTRTTDPSRSPLNSPFRSSPQNANTHQSAACAAGAPNVPVGVDGGHSCGGEFPKLILVQNFH